MLSHHLPLMISPLRLIRSKKTSLLADNEFPFVRCLHAARHFASVTLLHPSTG